MAGEGSLQLNKPGQITPGLARQLLPPTPCAGSSQVTKGAQFAEWALGLAWSPELGSPYQYTADTPIGAQLRALSLDRENCPPLTLLTLSDKCHSAAVASPEDRQPSSPPEVHMCAQPGHHVLHFPGGLRRVPLRDLKANTSNSRQRRPQESHQEKTEKELANEARFNALLGLQQELLGKRKREADEGSPGVHPSSCASTNPPLRRLRVARLQNWPQELATPASCAPPSHFLQEATTLHSGILEPGTPSFRHHTWLPPTRTLAQPLFHSMLPTLPLRVKRQSTDALQPIMETPSLQRVYRLQPGTPAQPAIKILGSCRVTGGSLSAIIS